MTVTGFCAVAVYAVPAVDVVVVVAGVVVLSTCVMLEIVGEAALILPVYVAFVVALAAMLLPDGIEIFVTAPVDVSTPSSAIQP